MLPKYHILLGALFSFFLYLFIKSLSPYQIVIIFLSSFLIDVDHYLFFVFRKKTISLAKAYHWYINLPKIHKPMMHFFHSVEFLTILFAISFFMKELFPILIGFLFHSILDLIFMISTGRLVNREYFLTRYLLSNSRNYL